MGITLLQGAQDGRKQVKAIHNQLMEELPLGAYNSAPFVLEQITFRAFALRKPL